MGVGIEYLPRDLVISSFMYLLMFVLWSKMLLLLENENDLLAFEENVCWALCGVQCPIDVFRSSAVQILIDRFWVLVNSYLVHAFLGEGGMLKSPTMPVLSTMSAFLRDSKWVIVLKLPPLLTNYWWVYCPWDIFYPASLWCSSVSLINFFSLEAALSALRKVPPRFFSFMVV